MFLYKNLLFFNIFYSFNPNHAYWNQRRLFSGNLPGMFLIAALIFSAGYYSAPIFSSNFALYHFAAFSTFCGKSF